ncbi:MULTISPECIES: heme exporter protein CcmB [Halomonas]|uniref:heme exporter protein CcmB n=1 Tax=Halomonas TaxID=2745 RepID=UPI001CD3B36B|nr:MULTISPECIES: heme exporter protein CcmB [Halomonas]MCA0915461.1 heme exporter protein CcmB [Halomonas denitrificans]
MSACSTDVEPAVVAVKEAGAGLGMALWATFQRDLVGVARRPADALTPLVFFAMVITLFPLGISPEPERLAWIAPGVLWVAALLSALLSLDGLFRADYEDGTLEQLLLAPHPLSLLVVAKVLVHWLTTGLPLALMAPLLGVLLALPQGSYLALSVTLAVGGGCISLIGAIGAGLTVGLARGGMLLSLLVLPLFMPVLIFGTGAMGAALSGGEWLPHLAVIGAMLALALASAPLAIAASLRISVHG